MAAILSRSGRIIARIENGCSKDRQPPVCDRYLPDLFSPQQWRILAKQLGLTPRQRQIARLICLGQTNDEMAVKLELAPHTVRMHKQALYRRLRIRDRIGVPIRVVIAFRDGALGQGGGDER